MNIQLNEQLIDEARQYAREQMNHPMNPELFSSNVFHNKLIELTIQECIREILKHDECLKTVCEEVKNHFGIKS